MTELRITLPKWCDLHAHLRQGHATMQAYLAAHAAMGCYGILAMPNTKPPLTRAMGDNNKESWTIREYRNMLEAAGAEVFSVVIVPLYLTRETTPQMIRKGATYKRLQAVKYYPPHGTTGTDHDLGILMKDLIGSDVLKAMEEAGIILCIHGEEHDITNEDYFARHTNAEEVFYRDMMPRLVEAHPNLKIVCEHVTTKVAVDFVQGAGPNVAATITPQHLLYTVGDLLRGCNYHLYCMPLVKYEEDREALRAAAVRSRKFFAGTDSAPHTKKQTPCGCAAGCFTGGIAPQLYAQAFEAAGEDLSMPSIQACFRGFLCERGPKFHGLPVFEGTFTLIKRPQAVDYLRFGRRKATPLPVGMNPEHDEQGTTIPWSIEL